MSTNILAGIVFIVVFGIVILIHEIGHFIVGRLMKVDIEEFGVGIPPKMMTLFHWKGTEFTLNWLPFGGFNRFKGENSLEKEELSEKGSLPAASPWARLAILLAGATMNLLFGIVVYSVIIAQIGIPHFDVIRIASVTPNTPASQAGFRAEDILLEMNGEAIKSDAQLRDIISTNMDKELSITLQRGDEIIETKATPLSSRSAEEGALGFQPDYFYDESPSFFSTISYGAEATMRHAQELLLLPARILRGTISPEEGRFLGFTSIFKFFQETVGADLESRVEEPAPSIPSPTSPAPTSSPTFYTLNLIASLTITLGVFNLMPFPALDGGRIFFILPELIFKKRVPAEFENIVHGVGMMLLLGFMLYINIMDVINPVVINLP